MRSTPGTAPAARILEWRASSVDAEPAREESTRPRWNFEEGAPILPGRLALKRLGGGSDYEAYLVWDEQLFALAVAKLLRPDRVADAHALRELRREAGLLQGLAHPLLVRGFGAVFTGPRPHILIEYAEGPTLRQVIERHGPLLPEQLVPLALHVVSVLQYLGSKRVVHLDVKPSNVVLGASPRLIDLSIARSFEDAARLRVAIGTDSYMAPEQCDPTSSASGVGPAADVWGLGATLYHACLGTHPFGRSKSIDGADPTVRFPQLVSDPPRLPKHVPQPLAQIIRQMLSRDPEERPSLREIAAALSPLVPEGRPRPGAR
ncbi:MAG TPA: serine/threonine-protein kinase [Myxococcaceae bacterium]|nr:serine/threonine-protein kinase [Myxococcaceae bacterium]